MGWGPSCSSPVQAPMRPPVCCSARSPRHPPCSSCSTVCPPFPRVEVPSAPYAPHLPPHPRSHGRFPPSPPGRLSICAAPKREATICDPAFRTVNVDAPCRSPTDFYQYSPWRAPGAAPMIDSCGVAGGVYQWQPAASAGGDYQNTANVRRGTALSGSISTVLTGLSWICVGVHSRRVLLSPVCA